MLSDSPQSHAVEAASWPLSRLGEGLCALAQEAGLSPRPSAIPLPPSPIPTSDSLSQWITATAMWVGLEANPVEARYAELQKLIRGAAPALIQMPGKEIRFLALLGLRRGAVRLVGADLRVHRLPVRTLWSVLGAHLEASLKPGIEDILVQAGVNSRIQSKARPVLLEEQLRQQTAVQAWLLYAPPGVRVWPQLRHAGLLQNLAAVIGLHLLEYILWIASWWLIGQAALLGRMDRGWLLAWALLLLSLVPLRLLGLWWQGKFAIRAGAMLKQRLLLGALRLEPEEIRHQGVGQLLGRVIESETVESLAVTGGFLGLFAGLELVLALLVLAVGAGSGWHVGLLAGWLAVSAVIGWRYWQHRQRWTDGRIDLTNDLVEGMVGHRTRLAQETSERWHAGEDQALEHYQGVSRLMDRRAARLLAVVPRGWLAVGLLGFVPHFVSAQGTPVSLAVGLGGLLMAFRALQNLSTSLWHLADARVAWREIAWLFGAAARPVTVGSPNFAATQSGLPAKSRNGQALLEVRELAFRHKDRAETVLSNCNLRVMRGDRILLEGASGAGKSTLASLLAGLRFPASGLLLLDGLDLQTWGATRWRQRVGCAPQYHENHMLTGTAAFNLLMGRRWPPQPEDMAEAETLCQELGLGGLLQRMPAGLLQVVGETGWQLSHGERSRVYLARALLQKADLVILDESLASLDPENLRDAMRCVLARAATVLIIAHP